MEASIIVPVYNDVEKALVTLNSLKKQTQKNYEIIVVDSSDNYSELKDYKAKKYRFFHTKRKGIAAARNFGVKKAKGKFIAFLDAGYTVGKDWLSDMVEELKKSNAVAVGGSFSFPKKSGTIKKFVNKNRLFRLGNKKRYVDTISTNNSIFYKDKIEEIGLFDEQFKTRGEDSDLCYRLTKKGHKILFNPEIKAKDKEKHGIRKFLKKSYENGYWHVRLYSKNREKAFGDDYRKVGFLFQYLLPPLFFIPFYLPLPQFFALAMMIILNFRFLASSGNYFSDIFLILLRSFSSFFGLINGFFEIILEKRKLFLIILMTFILFSSFNKLFDIEYSKDSLGEFTNTALFALDFSDCGYVITSSPVNLFGFSFFIHKMVGIFPHFFRVPFYWVFGWSVYTIRYSAAAIAIVTMLLAYFTLENFFDKKIAFLSSIIYSLLPNWIYLNKWGYAYGLFSVIIFFFLSLWYKKKDEKYLLMSTFFVGLAIVRHIVFVYVFISVVLIRLFVFKKKFSITEIEAFLLGVSPYIIFYFIFGNPIVFDPSSSFSGISSTPTGYNNLDIVPNLFLRFEQLSHIYFLPFLGFHVSSFLILVIFPTIYFFTLEKNNKPSLALVFFFWTFVLQSLFSPSSSMSLQLLPLSIFPISLIVSCLCKKEQIFTPLILLYILLLITFYLNPNEFMSPLNTRSETKLGYISQALEYTSFFETDNYFVEEYMTHIEFLTKCSIKPKYLSQQIDPKCYDSCFFDEFGQPKNLTKLKEFIEKIEDTNSSIILSNVKDRDLNYLNAFNKIKGINPNAYFGPVSIYIL